MDHIPDPMNPIYQPLVVPCLNPVPCEITDFDLYPASCGFSLDELLIGNFSQKAEHDTAVFLQDWLYFGVLLVTLGTSKGMYIERHPSTQYGRVTTASLEKHLQDRMTFLGSLLGKRDDHVWTTIRTAERCLERLSYFCVMTGSGVTDQMQWPLSPEIDLSLRVLGQRLTSALIGGLGSFVMQNSILWNLQFSNPVLPINRMIDNNWCPSEISRTLEQFSPASMYYVSLLDRSTTVRDHSQCTSRKCFAFLVNESTYQTKHVDEDCECSFLGPDISKLVQTIQSGSFPVLCINIDKRSDTVQVIVEEYEQGKEYIALSHVWADGLGNPTTNTLPICQLRKLKRYLDDLREGTSSLGMLNTGRVDAFIRKRKHMSPRFWMDTLCIPVAPSLKDFRVKSIKQMKDIYQNSYQVLVLDAELQAAGLTNLIEVFMRISLCGWMRRLWTLQEAVLGARLHIKFKDGILDLQKGYNDLQEQKRGHQKWDIARQINNTRGTPRSDALQFFWKMRTMRDRIFPADEAQFIGHKTTIIISPEAEQQQKERQKCAGIMEAFEAARYRTTSKAEDIYPCLAGLLGWEADGAFKAPVQQRLRLLMETQAVLPQGIIFVPGSRCTDLGWRWAVTDFDSDAQNKMQARIQDHTPAIRDDTGIKVKYAGLTLPETLLTGLKPIVVSSMSVQREDWKLWWKITPIYSWSPDDNIIDILAIIFYTPSPEIIFHKEVKMAAAFLAISKSEEQKIFDPNATVKGRFLSLAMVQLIGENHDVNVLLRRQGMDLRRLESLAKYVERVWTVQ